MTRSLHGSTPRRALAFCAVSLTLSGILAATHSIAMPALSGGPQQAGTPPQAPGNPLRARDGEFPRPEQATLLLAPSRLEVASGATIRMNIAVLGARNMTRLPVTLRYDSDLLDLVAIRLGDAWNDGPRPVFLHDEGRPGEVVIGIAQLGGSAGIVGPASVVELEFRALAPGDAELRLERFAVIGADSSSQPARAVPATISVR